MAFDVTALAAYIENQDFPLIAQMQATGGLAEVANIQTGIKGSSNLQFLDTNVTFGSDSCTRTASGATVFSQRTIVVGAIAVSEDLCVKDLNGYWAQVLVKKGAAGEEEMPFEIEEVYMAKKMNAMANALTLADFQGDLASGNNQLSYYDGLLKNANLFHYSGDEGQVKLYGTSVSLRPTVGLPGAAGTERMILTRDSNVTIGMDGDMDEDQMTVRLDPVSEKSIFFDVTFKRGVQLNFIDEVVEFTLIP